MSVVRQLLVVFAALVVALVLVCLVLLLPPAISWYFPPAPAIATPGVIWPSAPTLRGHGTLAAWDYQPSAAIVYTIGSWEWFPAPPRVEALNWSTRRFRRMPIPGLEATDYYEFAQSPDPDLIAYSSNTFGDVFLYRVSTGEATLLGKGSSPSFLPDARHLAIVVDFRSIVLVDLATLEQSILWTVPNPRGVPGNEHYQMVTALSWSPSGEAYAFIVETRRTADADRTQTEVLIGQTSTSDATAIASDVEWRAGYSEPTWSPDGRLVAFVHHNAWTDPDELILYDWANSCAAASLALPELQSAAWDPDGDTILIQYAWSYDLFISVQRAFGASYRELSCVAP